MELCTVSELREQTANRQTPIDLRIEHTNEIIAKERAKFHLLRRDIEVMNIGSTAPSRGTYVLDPTGQYFEFPPDIDLNILVPPNLAERDLRRILQDMGLTHANGAKRHQDRNHGKQIISLETEGVVISAAVFCPNASERAVLRYNEVVGQFAPRLQTDAKALRLVLQRSGAYAGYNLGLSGLCIDEIVRQTKSFEEAMAFLACVAVEPEKRKVLHPISGNNLLGSVSRSVWRRILSVAETFSEDRLVPAKAINLDEWRELNPDMVSIGLATSCCVKNCGREGADIANVMRVHGPEFLNRISSGPAHEYFLIPCAGFTTGHAHTAVIIDLPYSPHFSAQLLADEGRRFVDNIENLPNAEVE